MRIERLRPTIFQLTLSAFEIAVMVVMVAAARWVTDGAEGEMTRRADPFTSEIGTEGTLKFRVQSGPTARSPLRSRGFNANGDSRGPQTPTDTWEFCGPCL